MQFNSYGGKLQYHGHQPGKKFVVTDIVCPHIYTSLEISEVHLFLGTDVFLLVDL